MLNGDVNTNIGHQTHYDKYFLPRIPRYKLPKTTTSATKDTAISKNVEKRIGTKNY